ncbi:MAG: hypothetical protein ACFFCS_14580 [Candidatus Hodarchaeota archaeon]
METRIFDTIDRLSLGVLITILMIGGIYYWIKAKKRDNFNEKHLLIALSGFFIGFAFTRLF